MTLPPHLSERTTEPTRAKRGRAVHVLFGLPAWTYIVVAVTGLVAAVAISLFL
jgi:hypothetical protein